MVWTNIEITIYSLRLKFICTLFSGTYKLFNLQARIFLRGRKCVQGQAILMPVEAPRKKRAIRLESRPTIVQHRPALSLRQRLAMLHPFN